MDGELVMIIESDPDIKLELQKVATTMVKLLCDTVEGDNYLFLQLLLFVILL